MEKKFFSKALGVSCVLHAIVITILSLSGSGESFFKKKMKSIEVTYQSVNPLKEKKKEIVFKDLKVTKSQKAQTPPKVKVLTKNTGNNLEVFGERVQDLSKISGKLAEGQKKIPKITLLDIERKITLPPLTTEKITNPQYLTYNDDMRAAISRNIKQRAYTYVNHKDFQSGKVYLTFVLASSGVLKQVQIIESRTFANNYLREVALRSIKESSPFPPFPIGFNYPEFTFNLLISFQE